MSIRLDRLLFGYNYNRAILESRSELILLAFSHNSALAVSFLLSFIFISTEAGISGDRYLFSNESRLWRRGPQGQGIQQKSANQGAESH